MSIDRWLLYLHILAAGTWLGSGLLLVLLAVRAKQVGKELDLINQMEWVGTRIGGPSVILTLATGIWMVLRSNVWQFDQGWVLGGLIILAVLFLVGVGFHVPQYKRIHKAKSEHGDDSPTVQRLMKQSFAAAQIEVVLLAIAIFLMVFKPGI
jgi:uncharacterized membrane protein